MFGCGIAIIYRNNRICLCVYSYADSCLSELVWPNYPYQVEVIGSSSRGVEYDVVYAQLGNTFSFWKPYHNNDRASQFIQVCVFSPCKLKLYTTLYKVLKSFHLQLNCCQENIQKEP